MWSRPHMKTHKVGILTFNSIKDKHDNINTKDEQKYLSSVPLITKVKPAKHSGAPSGTS